MQRIVMFVLGVCLGSSSQAYTTNLISNGSFESGTNGWLFFTTGSSAQFQIASTAHSGTNALRVSNRQHFAEAPQQDVTPYLALATNGSTWVTRLEVQVSAVTQVRAWLAVVANVSGTLVTNRFIMAERVVRATNQWERLEGVKTVAWSGNLSHALFYTESGMRAEAPPASAAYPVTLFDAVEVLPDDDGDGLANEEETSTRYGTSPGNRDTDGDGLPDGWEVFNGTDALTNDANADADHDFASNWQEYWAATSPTNTLSFPGKPRTNILSSNALAILAYLAKLPSAPINRVIAGQHVTDIETDWSNHVARLPLLTGRWPAVVSFAAEGGPTATPQLDKVLPRALEVWTNGGLPLIKWQIANPWTGSGLAPAGVENISDMLRVTPTNAADVSARSNYLALRDNIATNLALLRDSGVVVLFRPLSEMNGAWFWQGNRRRAEFIALWRDLHDHYTFTRGLTNLLWVYESDAGFAHIVAGSPNSSGTMVDYYYPGDDLVDIAGHNLYDDDWRLAFDPDAIWRRYGKVFAVPQAGKGSGQSGNTNWSNLTFLGGISNTVQRCSFFCAWNSFSNGTNTVYHAISDNAQAAELMNSPWVMTREELNWRYELPFALGLDRIGPSQFRVNWQGGILQHSPNLLSWTNVPNAAQPHLYDASGSSPGFWRLMK